MYEAAKEGASPKRFDRIEDAWAYVRGSPLSRDGNRPWIRKVDGNKISNTFIMIGGQPTPDAKRIIDTL